MKAKKAKRATRAKPVRKWVMWGKFEGSEGWTLFSYLHDTRKAAVSHAKSIPASYSNLDRSEIAERWRTARFAFVPVEVPPPEGKGVRL